MKKKLLAFVFGFIYLFTFDNTFNTAGIRGVQAAPPMPPMRGDGTPNIAVCVDLRCESADGPVCGIDSSGVQRTFENRCVADLAYCREGRFYVVVKHGEC